MLLTWFGLPHLWRKLMALELTSRNGDFVHSSQQMGSKESGFSKVSQKWLNTTIEVDTALAEISDQNRQREDILADKTAFSVDAKGVDVVVNVDNREFKPTRHALLQLAFRASKLPQTWVNFAVDSGKPEFVANMVDSIRIGLSSVDSEKQFRFRTYQDGTLRACLTTDFSPIDSTWFLNQYKELLPGCSLSHWRGDSDEIYGNILIPDFVRHEDDSEHGGGLSIGNSEIGTRRCFQTPFIFRAICQNGCIWDRVNGERFSVVHRRKGDIAEVLKELRVQLATAIDRDIPLAKEHLDKFLACRSFTLPANEVKTTIAAVCHNGGLTPELSREVLTQFVRKESDFRSLYGIVNAITRASQTTDRDTAYGLDAYAGTLVRSGNVGFDRLRNKGKEMTVDDIKKVFGLAV